MALWDDALSFLGGLGDPEAEGAAQASMAMSPAVSHYLSGVAQSLAPQDYYDPNRSFAANVLDPRAMQQAQNIAMGVSGGGMATRRPSGLITAPYLSKGADAPLFDYSLPPPDVPQTALTRAPEPPKGIPDYVRRVSDPANMDRVEALTRQGLDLLGDRYWYNPSPLTHALGDVLGGDMPEATGRLKLFADMMGNTTNLARVPQNMRMASYYTQKFLEDPETMPTEVPPEGSGYGHVAQQQHLRNVQDWWPTQSIDPQANPKPASFSEDIMGNYLPYTWDARMGTVWDLRNTKGKIITAPDQAHYGYLEGTGQTLAERMGLPPARQQEATWVTMEDPNKPVRTFAEGVEDAVRRAADQFNLDPRDVWKWFAHGKQTLWGAGALPTGLLGNQLVPSDDSAR